MKSNKPYFLDTQDPEYNALTKHFPGYTKIICFKAGSLERAFENELNNWVEAHPKYVDGHNIFPLEMERMSELAGKFTTKMAFLFKDGPKEKSVTFAFTENSYSTIEDIIKKYVA